MRILALALLILARGALADTFLCVAEAAAVVEDGGNRAATAALANPATMKYVQTQEQGAWVVKELGKEYLLFDKCTSVYFCEHSKGYAGIFIREGSGRFSITWITQDRDRNQLVVAKGRCSKI